jgi:tetratricopeptide (TPR) repeat protein
MSLKPGMAYWLLGRIAEKNKDMTDAERQYRAGIAATHSGARAWLELAIFFRHANRLDDMEKALREIENAPVDHHEALMDGASLLMRTGRDPALGIRLLRRYFSAGPVEEGPAFKAHEYWGQLLERQGDHRAAAQEYHSALALFHNYRRAEEGLSEVEGVAVLALVVHWQVWFSSRHERVRSCSVRHLEFPLYLVHTSC